MAIPDNPCGFGSRIRRHVVQSGSDIKKLFSHAASVAGDHWKTTAVFLLIILAVAAMLKPNEMWLLKQIQGFNPSGGNALRETARQICYWGDYHTGTLILCLTLWVIALIKRSSYLRHTALVCLLAAGLAGLFTDVLRCSLGRARPNSGLQDDFYGFSLKSKYQGFPSGHATTAFGTAVPIAILCPPLALPSLAIAASVGWSRLYVNAHRPTDVLVGCGVGVAFGGVFGFAARRKLQAERGN